MTNKQFKPRGYIIYRGASMLDGKPIVVVAITSKSSNVKTGDMVQTYILPDNGLSPVINAKLLNDVSVCGDCKHRRGLGGSCYVNLGQGVRAVADGVVRGIYPERVLAPSIACKGRKVRLGTYGDPMAVPAVIWFSLLAQAEDHTGYTHQWDNQIICNAHPEHYKAIMQLCMASTDTLGETLKAKLAGYRTFRVRRATDAALLHEFECPASAEQNKRLTCDKCLACDGTRQLGDDSAPSKHSKLRASPVIIVHGSLKNRFQGV